MTDTAWTFGGTALTTFGKVTLINDYLDMPARRGNDIDLPFTDGGQFVNKFYGARTLTFGVAINVADAATLESTLDTLRKLLAVRTQQTLSMTLQDSTVRTISASVNKPLQINRIGAKLAKCMIEFVCPFPFWRLSTAISSNTTTINANPKAMTVTNPGTVAERRASIILTGPLSNTVITNSTNGNVLTYTGTIASPRVVTISYTAAGEVTATDDLAANKISNITHTPEAAFMIFETGANTLSIADSTHSTGTVQVTFNAPFI